MALIGWVDTETNLDDWLDAPTDPQTLELYLQAAYEQCVRFLPHVGGAALIPTPVPSRMVLAQVMQARAIYRAVLSGSGDAVGADGLSVTVFPLDWQVRQMLRPKRVGRVL